ncbi:MAG: bifunctional riboflavin kinase/FAD synthetase [Thermoleophilia bacterium]
MRLYRNLDEVHPAPAGPRAVAVGVFDGVHRGHQEIIRRAVAAGRNLGGPAAVLTFEPHPDAVVGPGAAPAVLTTLRQKLELVEELGMDEVVVVAFDEAFAGISPESFCGDLLRARMGAGHVTVGANFRFGAGGRGTSADLARCGERAGFSVEAVELLRNGAEVISSTRIREFLLAGRVREAARLLGRPHSVEGYVVAGAGRGRDLGVPTANVEVHGGVVVPAAGVYVTNTVLEGRVVPSVTSVGTNPTFEFGADVRVEAHLLDFSGGLYGRWIRVEFLEKLRDQRRFGRVEDLVAQMRSDIARAAAYFA